MAERAFNLYDTQSRQVKPLVTLEPRHLRFYSCGPTVYSYAHIGNFRTFITADLIVRTVEALGWRVSFVTNITDVGHLTQDDVADASGEDRMEGALRSKEGEKFRNVWDLADYYAETFKQDWLRLNLKRPMLWPKATQHMTEQIDAVAKLIENGHAYETPTGVYFDVNSFDRYGELSGNKDREQLITGVRDVVQDENKRQPADFALWKKDDKHLMQWHSPWGKGFPGWHIECSVMAMEYLGETLDLHAGGEDLVFPHHECEIAQSEALTGKRFANHWVHTRFLLVDGEKMSKRLGNFYTARDLVDEKGVDPLALRYALMATPYGKSLNFTLQGLADASKAIERYAECARKADAATRLGRAGEDAVGTELDRLYEEALDAMCDDLNTSVALAKAYEGTKVILREGDALSAPSGEAAKGYLEKIGGLLGIVPSEPKSGAAPRGKLNIDEERIEAMIAERAALKGQKRFAEADAIRAQLEAAGVELRDTPEGVVWRQKGVLAS